MRNNIAISFKNEIIDLFSEPVLPKLIGEPLDKDIDISSLKTFV